jgi:hypothetical protein
VKRAVRALHAETLGNYQQRNRLRQADPATLGNTPKQAPADCGSRRCRGFEPRRSPSLFPLKLALAVAPEGF